MGSSRVVNEVENGLRGIRFRVESSELRKKAGVITLRCDVHSYDVKLFEACVAKLDGLKIFTGDMVEEVLGALGDALTGKEEELQSKEAKIEELTEALAAKEEEVARLRSLMRAVGIQLGIEQG